MKIGFIGSGKMAEALLGGFLAKKAATAKEVWVSDKSSERLNLLKGKYKVNAAKDNAEVVQKSETVFLCVKPQNMKEVLEELAGAFTARQLVVSIAAGISLEFLERKISKARIVRVMPNTPALVGEGMSAFCLGKKATAKDAKEVRELLEAVGKAIEVKEEKLLDIVTALSGSGPAFIAIALNGMAEKARQLGLSQSDARLLAEQTALGTARLLIEKKMKPTELVEMVASPGGTTFAGLGKLHDLGAEKAFAEAISAAAKRAEELRRENE
ncbi:MAG: pyrroline-5-carboxylate reductase [Candidatus Diapherotrites archaeon]